MTGRLADRAGQVVAVEIDERLVTLLRRELAARTNVTIVHGDILDLDPPQVIRQHAGQGEQAPAYKVVANLPYYITSHVLRHVLESSPPPALCVLMVQKEVAQRMVAAPGDLSVLGVSVQFYAEPELLFVVPPGAFRPVPKVESAVVRLAVRPQPAVPDVAPALFFRVVRAGFGQKRKQLANSLSGGLALPKEQAKGLLRQADIDPSRRAETLSLEEWGALARLLR
jgi:16S rRNA (adenine1518-N6/adenine1519-N6)-dimethyltransferase